jgi:glycosyltransferase involved in cell wall biosynthesis
LKAFELFRVQTGSRVKLVAVGRRFWKNEMLDDTLRQMNFADDVVFTGHLEQAELTKVLGSALALVYVSYFEGFGVPIVEAFQSGVPVITSNITSMPEVAGNAALLVDPFREDEIAHAMNTLYSDSELRRDLIARGLQRATYFSWDHSAKRFWSVIERTVNQK